MSIKKQPTRGIILIALGSPYYGNLASNLAASIAYTAKGMPITLVATESAIAQLSPARRAVFSSIVICPPEYYNKDGRTVYIKAKTHLYDMSPYDESIFLDVDTILLSGKSIAAAFDELSAQDFTMENRSRIDLASNAEQVYLWAKVADIKKGYKLSSGYLYGLHSEFIYWKRCPKMKAFFASVKKAFMQPKCEVVKFDGDMPDEFAFAIAMLEHNIYPHACPYVPLYWYLTDRAKGTSLSYCMANYYGYSVGGNATPDAVRKVYDTLSKAYAQRLSIDAPYPLRQKRQVLTSRALM
jgi:hypothetical protein